METGRNCLLITLVQVAVVAGESTIGQEVKIKNDFLWGLVQIVLFQLLPLGLLNFLPIKKALESKKRQFFSSILFASQVLMVVFTTIMLSIAA